MVHLAQNDPVIKKLREALVDTSFADKTYLVGGSVRDLLLGRQITDYDLCIELPGGDVSLSEYLFSGGLCSSLQKYKNHNIISCTMGDSRLELAQTITTHSRTAKAEFGTLLQDAMGRDFTINSLYLSLQDLSLIDPTGRGRKDLKTRTISSVRDPATCFTDDPLRMLRALRFQLSLGLNLETQLWHGIRDNAFRIASLPIERISDEIFLMLDFDAAQALELLQDSGILEQLCQNVHQSLLKFKQEAFFLQDLLGILPEHSEIDQGFGILCFLCWLNFSFGKSAHHENIGSQEATAITTGLLQDIGRILILPRRTQTSIARIFPAYLYISEQIKDDKERDPALLFTIDYLASDSPYLKLLLSWDGLTCPKRSAIIANIIATGSQYYQESAARSFPISGSDLLPCIEKSEYNLIGSYLLLLRLRWLQDPDLDHESMLHALHQLRAERIDPAHWHHISTVQNRPDWLWEWESWKHQNWI
ncbi:MAG: hypothetical protein PHY48_11800 [Candidatus Cloacimonetes bacterium]|jgi:poly(A) polymerase|nr:hypothetical protein [Candidatus Cloacimonadota bacterium]